MTWCSPFELGKHGGRLLTGGVGLRLSSSSFGRSLSNRPGLRRVCRVPSSPELTGDAGALLGLLLGDASIFSGLNSENGKACFIIFQPHFCHHLMVHLFFSMRFPHFKHMTYFKHIIMVISWLNPWFLLRFPREHRDHRDHRWPQHGRIIGAQPWQRPGASWRQKWRRRSHGFFLWVGDRLG